MKPRLDKLEDRLAAIKNTIAAERITQQKRKEKSNARLFSIVGEALVEYGAKSADFKTMLRQVLAGSVTDESSRKFLTSEGWL